MHFLFAALTLAWSSAACGSPSDRAAITAVVKAKYPHNTKISTITTTGGYADVTVLWGSEAGGTVLLAKRSGGWKILTTGGGAYDASSMQKYGGIPASAADKLWKVVASGACEKGH